MELNPIMSPDGADDSNDLLAERFATIVIYWLPIAVLVASGFFAVGNAGRTVIWALALITMGVGCLVNALRCGRVHCYAGAYTAMRPGLSFYSWPLLRFSTGLGLRRSARGAGTRSRSSL